MKNIVAMVKMAIVECQKCGFIDSSISLIADWEEDDERD